MSPVGVCRIDFLLTVRFGSVFSQKNAELVLNLFGFKKKRDSVWKFGMMIS